jgi:hypothetical protein
VRNDQATSRAAMFKFRSCEASVICKVYFQSLRNRLCGWSCPWKIAGGATLRAFDRRQTLILQRVPAKSSSLLKNKFSSRTVLERLFVDDLVDTRPRKCSPPKGRLGVAHGVFKIYPRVEHVSMPHHQDVQRRQEERLAVIISVSCSREPPDCKVLSLVDRVFIVTYQHVSHPLLRSHQF